MVLKGSVALLESQSSWVKLFLMVSVVGVTVQVLTFREPGFWITAHRLVWWFSSVSWDEEVCRLSVVLILIKVRC